MNILFERVLVDAIGDKERTLEEIAKNIQNDLGADMTTKSIDKPMHRLVLEGVITKTKNGFILSREMKEMKK